MRSILTLVIACLLFPSIFIQSAKAHPRKEKKTSEQQQPQTDRESEALDFSGTGRPGQQTAGESRGSCSNESQAITAMLPTSNSGRTVLGHPNFWVYFPKSANKTTAIEFVIQDESRKDIWRSRSALNPTAGYQSFSLPKTEAPLEVGRWYRWYVKVYCDEQVASTQYVQGWVNRVPLNSKLYLELQQNPQKSHITYGNNNLWYDAIDRLLSLYHRSPENVALEKDWHSLVRAKGVDLDRLPHMSSDRISQQEI